MIEELALKGSGVGTSQAQECLMPCPATDNPRLCNAQSFCTVCLHVSDKRSTWNLVVISLLAPGSASRGTPTPGSWLGVGGGNYSDAGVGEKCLDCAEEKRSCLKGI